MQRITPNLWFDTQAVEAVEYYISIFPDSRLNSVSLYGEAGAASSGMKKGSVMTVSFTVDGQDFLALNGGPVFKFNEAVSLIVNCKNQQEIDHYWDKLTQGGDKKAQVCGWLKDKFGVSWQVVPTALAEMMQNPDAKKTERVMAALLKMKKIDVNLLKKAYEGT